MTVNYDPEAVSRFVCAVLEDENVLLTLLSSITMRLVFGDGVLEHARFDRLVKLWDELTPWERRNAFDRLRQATKLLLADANRLLTQAAREEDSEAAPGV